MLVVGKVDTRSWGVVPWSVVHRQGNTAPCMPILWACWYQLLGSADGAHALSSAQSQL